MAHMDDEQSLISLLDDVAQLLKEAKSRFPGSTMAAVDRDYLLDLVYSARDLVPEQLARADELLGEAVRLKEEAKAEASLITHRGQKDAENIVREAREQASRLISQDAITVGAKAEAQRIVDDAQRQAEKLSQGADDYCDAKLRDLQEKIAAVENTFAEVLTTVTADLSLLTEQVDSGRSVIAERSSGKQKARMKPFVARSQSSPAEADVEGVPSVFSAADDFSATPQDSIPTAAMAPTAAEPDNEEY